MSSLVSEEIVRAAVVAYLRARSDGVEGAVPQMRAALEAVAVDIAAAALGGPSSAAGAPSGESMRNLGPRPLSLAEGQERYARCIDERARLADQLSAAKQQVEEMRERLGTAEVVQADLAEILRVLDLGDHARPVSPREVVLTEVLPRLRLWRAVLDAVRVSVPAEVAEQVLGRPG